MIGISVTQLWSFYKPQAQFKPPSDAPELQPW